MLKALSLAAVVVAATGSSFDTRPGDASLTEERVVVSEYLIEEVARAVQEMEPQNCVDCRWHQKCDPNQHTADVIEDGPKGGAHGDCIVNPTPWCSGHPACGTASAVEEAVIREYAVRVADGDLEALQFIRTNFSAHLRYNADLRTHEILPCPQGRPIVSAPEEWFTASSVGE